MSDFRKLWDELAPIGRDAGTGGYLRYAFSPAERECRAWFAAQAAHRGLALDEDGNGNLFAWWGDPAAGGAVVTGSHFDSVPHGGAYDGPLGIVSAFLAVDLLRERGHAPRVPVAVAAFVEEEGGRFGVPCLGSRLLTGAIAPERAGALRDPAGVSFAEALGAAPAGARPELVGRIGHVVELHVEQGRDLVYRDAAVGVGTAIWPHGRWRVALSGEPNHAGTTAMVDRRDPMLTAAYLVLAANKQARLRDARATVGRLAVAPNATNAVPERVTAWLDARAADAATLTALVDEVTARVAERAGRDGTTVEWTAESVTPEVGFDPALAARLAALLGGAPLLPTAAGHDAGVLSAHVPTAMLFVRNPTGVSHSPAETAADADCVAGIAALADVLAGLT
ncbi:Zn-dependent hydrolase [Pilimelia anulata]|uniref:Zn-dependent hydrolase n=1 Tax=Pilimelia anulata TaxID=53371 RepID=A0A8J3B9Y0_9ACTN|nr:allantoate amidohydrolase [Pilimelia anulata]GGK06170.1 Zn-dependent hydrolase [Pilimelia anulata]